MIQMAEFIKNSYFRTNGQDHKNYDDPAQQIFSSFTKEDLMSMGMMEYVGFKFLDEKYSLFSEKLEQIRINLSTPAERNFVHTDNITGKTFLYYVNLEWRVEWGGHTLFMDDNIQDAVYTCLYKPGRAVVFDGSTPHMIMTPSVFCPVNRYTFALQTR